LRRKGLTQAEIDVALQRTRPSALLVQAPPPPPPSSSSPLQQQQYYQQQMQFVPQRTPRRASSLSSWLWFAIAAAGVGGVLAIAFRAVWNAIFVAERARKSRRKAVKDGGQISDSDNDDAVAGNRGSESDDDDAVDDVIDDDEDDDISDKGPTAKVAPTTTTTTIIITSKHTVKVS
jgi:hypothetical protein